MKPVRNLGCIGMRSGRIVALAGGGGGAPGTNIVRMR